MKIVYNEGSPPQGLSEARRGSSVFFFKYQYWSAAGAPRRGRRHISLSGVWGYQPPSSIPELNDFHGKSL